MSSVRIAGACLAAALIVLAPVEPVALAQAPVAIAGERMAVRTTVESTAQIMAREDNPGDAADNLTLGAGSSFTALQFSQTSTLPPDGSAAAGTTQFIALANGRIRSFLKSGVPDGVLNLTPTTFFATVKGTGTPLSGRIRFDRLAGRWFIVMATNSVPGRIVIASSNGPTVTAATLWSFSAFDNSFLGADCTTDAPSLGIDPAALYIGANQFCTGGTTYRGSSAWVVRKSTVVDGATAVVTAFHDLTGGVAGAGPFAPQGVTNDDPSIPYGYFLGVDNAAFGQLVLRRVSTPGGTPTLSGNINIAVAPTGLPIPVRHKGNTGGASGYLSAVDDRLASIYMKGSSAWVAHTIGVTHTGTAGGSTTRDGVRWYEIGSLDATPVVLQSGTLHDPAGPGSLDERNYFNASIATSQLGRTVIGFSAAGTNEFVNGGVVDRAAADAAGTLTAPFLLTSSAAAYNLDDPASPNIRRWGSYSETVADGCDGRTIWSMQQFVDSTNSYALRAAKVQGPAPPSPISVAPATVPSGVASLNVVVTASAGSAGQAFFVAPAGFACVATASIPGVVVNSVTVNSPTQVTVNISTVNATGGSKLVTIINPDGQSASGTARLSVLGGTSTPPIGTVDTPLEGSTAAGEIGITGWAVSESGVQDVSIYRSPTAGEGPALVFIGQAVFSRGARPDVQAQFPTYADSDAAGWGYMVLTNMLPNQGTGVFTFHAYATNYAGQTTLLGSKNVTLTNGTSQAPFGSIDTPGQGATVSGTIVNFGWALAKAGRIIPTDGSTIDVYIDNVLVGHPTYNNFRADIAALFPGLANSNGAIGHYTIDTRTLANGVHTIFWIIRDNTGQASGVGSRFFTVQNGS
jgi:hypothetical protein